MSVLAVNFKHLYQRRLAWFWYFILLSQTPWILLPILTSQHDRHLGYLIISLITGILAGGLQKDVLAKPFSFCLPGHRRIPRAFIFWTGGVVNLLLGCIFLAYPGLSFPYTIIVILAGGFVGMIAYFYGVYTSFQAIPSPRAGIIPFLVAGMVFFQWDVALQNVIVNQPIVVFLAAGLVCVWSWKLLGRDFLARKYCGKLAMGMLDCWNLKKIEKYRQAQAERNMTDTKMKFFAKAHEFFLGRMGQCDFLSRDRYVWGNLYAMFGKHFGHLRMKSVLGFLATVVFLILFFGFIGPNEKENRMIFILFIIPVFSVCSMDLMPYRTVLFPAGRRDKYYSTLILSVAVTLLAGLLVLAVTGISVFLEKTLPEFSLRQWPRFVYYGMDIGDSYLYLLFMPMALTLSIAFPRTKPWLAIVLGIGLMQVWIISEIVSKRSMVDVIGPIGIAGLIAICWAGFLVVLHYVCIKRSLVTQAAGK